MTRVVILLMVFLCHSAHANEVLPTQIHAHYVVSKSGMEVASIDETYTRKNNHYVLLSVAKPLGLLALFKPGKVTINSSGNIVEHGLQPQLFSYQHEGDTRKDNHAEFDWQQHQLNLFHDGQTQQLSLSRGAQDRLSAMYHFMFMELKNLPEVEFDMTNGRGLDHYHYRVENGADYTLSGNALQTFYLDSQAKSGETRTQLWLAVQRYNLPCKLIVTDADGGQLTQTLRTLDIQP